MKTKTTRDRQRSKSPLDYKSAKRATIRPRTNEVPQEAFSPRRTVLSVPVGTDEPPLVETRLSRAAAARQHGGKWS